MKTEMLVGSKIVEQTKILLQLTSVAMLFCLAVVGIVSCADEKSESNATYIFIQEGTGGGFVKDDSGNYTLTISGVIPYTLAFADRPARDAGFIKMADFLEGFYFDPADPPNAAIIVRDAKEDENMIVVELTDPRYDEANMTLNYKAKVTHDFEFQSNWGEELPKEVDASIPESFGNVTAVIDDRPCLRGAPGCIG